MEGDAEKSVDGLKKVRVVEGASGDVEEIGFDATRWPIERHVLMDVPVEGPAIDVEYESAADEQSNVHVDDEQARNAVHWYFRFSAARENNDDERDGHGCGSTADNQPIQNDIDKLCDHQLDTALG